MGWKWIKILWKTQGEEKKVLFIQNSSELASSSCYVWWFEWHLVTYTPYQPRSLQFQRGLVIEILGVFVYVCCVHMLVPSNDRNIPEQHIVPCGNWSVGRLQSLCGLPDMSFLLGTLLGIFHGGQGSPWVLWVVCSYAAPYTASCNATLSWHCRDSKVSWPYVLTFFFQQFVLQ